MTTLSFQRSSVNSHQMLLMLQFGKSSRSLKLVEQLQSTSKAPMPQAKILMQKVSTKSENKATQKPKCTRGKAGTRIHKAIQQRSHSSQILNKGSCTDKDKSHRIQNLNHQLARTCVNIVETQDTDQDLTVLQLSTNARSARTMVTSPASASQKYRTQM